MSRRKFDYEAIRALVEKGATHEQAAWVFGCSTTTVGQALLNRPDYEGGRSEIEARKSYEVPDSEITPPVRRLLEMFTKLPPTLRETET